MDYEQALKKLRGRLESDIKDLEREVVRLNGKHEAYSRALDLIDSLILTVKQDSEAAK